jgi:hypothetical protein
MRIMNFVEADPQTDLFALMSIPCALRPLPFFNIILKQVGLLPATAE